MFIEKKTRYFPPYSVTFKYQKKNFKKKFNKRKIVNKNEIRKIAKTDEIIRSWNEKCTVKKP